MHLKLIIGLLIQVLFASASIAQTWQSLNGPLESDIGKIIVREDTIYVASVELGGFFKKHKDADHWSFINIPEIEVLNTIEIGLDGTYYAGGSGPSTEDSFFRFFVSNNYGKNGQLLHEGLEDCTGPHSVINEIIFTASESLVISCSDRIFKFDKEKKAFLQSSGNRGNPTNRAFTFYEYADTLFAERVNGFEYSTDDGDSWTSSSFDSLEVFSITYIDDNLFVGTNKGLYNADAVNGTFEIVDEQLNVPVHALHPYQNQLIAGTDSGVFLINPENFEVQAIFQSHDFAPIKAINSIEDALLFGTESGFYECNLGEVHCKLTGVPNSKVRTMNFQNNDTLWVGTTENIHRYFLHTDQWDTLSLPIGRAKNIIPAGKDSFYVANDSYFQRCSFSSSSCDSLQIDPGNVLFDVKQNTAGDLFIASSERVYKSSDQGENWEVIYTNADNINFSLFTYSDSLLFINGGELIKYSLNTNTSKILNNSVSNITSNGTVYSAVNGIQKSTDFGETWSTILQGSRTLNDKLGGIKFILYDENLKRLYGVTTAGGVYVSENGGLDWGVNEELYHTYIESATIGKDGTLYLGTGKAGVFANTKPLNPPISISNENATTRVPNNFKLLASYPNPFNPSTTISYQLNSTQKVSLNVFNVLGQQVANYDLGLRQAGIQNFKLDLSDQASGVYIIRIQSGSEIQSGKITLIK